jgi:flagellar motor component MotA
LNKADQINRRHIKRVEQADRIGTCMAVALIASVLGACANWLG